MHISIKSQIITTLFSIVLGILLGFIFEIFNTLKLLFGSEPSEKIKKRICKLKHFQVKRREVYKISKIHKWIIDFVFDLLFFVFITPIMQIYIYAFSNGIVRWYIILGAIIGYLLYYVTIGRIIRYVLEYIFIFLKAMLQFLMHYIILPFRKVFEFFKMRFEKCYGTRKRKQSDKTASKNIIFSYGQTK